MLSLVLLVVEIDDKCLLLIMGRQDSIVYSCSGLELFFPIHLNRKADPTGVEVCPTTTANTQFPLVWVRGMFHRVSSVFPPKDGRARIFRIFS